MIAFIIPLKPIVQSKNWEKDCALLEKTIISLLNQVSKQFCIYVVYADKPALNITSEKLQLIHFPYPFIPFSAIMEAPEIFQHFSYDKIMLERRWDKSRKIFYGCKVAKEQGCDYLMSVDADDLLSNKLTAYIQSRVVEENIPGFYINNGYLYQVGEKQMIKIVKGMQNLNGSTHILRADLIKIPDFVTGKWMDYNLYTSHGWIVERLRASHAVVLEPIPFPGVIYIAHGGNISGINQWTLSGKIKYFIKSLLRGQKITNTIRQEFLFDHR